MGLRINTNITAMNAHRLLGINDNALSKSLSKLSSGLRINGAQDDAAGLAIAEKFKGQVKGLNQAVANSQDAINLLQTAEGGLNETETILQRMRELAVQGANDTLTVSDRNNITDELIALTEEIDRIARTTQFNTHVLLNGGTATMAGFTFQVGANDNQFLNFKVGQANAEALSLAAFTASVGGGYTATTIKFDYDGDTTIDYSVSSTAEGTEYVKYERDSSDYNTAIDNGLVDANRDGIADADSGEFGYRRYLIRVDTAAAASVSISKLDDAIATVSAYRSQLGANINRLEHTISNLNVQAENTAASESRIRDLDMAKEASQLTRSQILAQSSQAMLAQANQQPQSVLQLLR